MMLVEHPRSRKDEAGFSLMELMLVITILLVITGSVFRTVANGVKSFDAELANAEAQENARYAIDRVAEIIKTAGNNPQNLTALNNLSFIRLYNQPVSGTFDPASPGTQVSVLSGSGTGNAVNLLSDFNGDANTTTDVSIGTVSSIFSKNIVTSENLMLYCDKARNLAVLYNFNAPTAEKTIPIADFVTDLKFTLDVGQNQVTINLTARSNRAAAIENIYERRFRYANLVSVVRLRNR
jgi:prepilin-type N-terminal cleavage/methylation domain-containing protein